LQKNRRIRAKKNIITQIIGIWDKNEFIFQFFKRNIYISVLTYNSMTNITLSIRDDIYEKMKQHSEVKWSEFVRKVIEERVNALDEIEESKYISSLSEELLEKDWDNQ
jgi:predicted CopG family antitoxin